MPHTSLKVMENVVSLGCTVLLYPELMLSDFCLFRLMKDRLFKKCFPRNGTFIAAVKQWFTSSGADFHEPMLRHEGSCSLLAKNIQLMNYGCVEKIVFCSCEFALVLSMEILFVCVCVCIYIVVSIYIYIYIYLETTVNI